MARRAGRSLRGLALRVAGVTSLSLIGCSTRSPGSGAAGGGNGGTLSAEGGTGGAGSRAGGVAGDTSRAGAAGAGAIIDSSNGGVSGHAGDPSVCADVQVTVTRVVPTIALLIEQSNSMDQMLEAGMDFTRWDALKEVLLAPEDGVISMLEGDARMGLVLYANPPPYYPPDCPDLTEVMPPALDNYQKIAESFAAAPTIPNGPTAESLQVVAARLEEVAEPGPKYILLGTNGDPDSCDEVAGFNKHDDETKALVVAAVQDARAKGIGTLVVSVGRGPTARAHLQAVANAGAGLSPDAQPGAPFYEPATRDGLREALATAIRGTRTCTFDLRGEVEPSSAHRGTVTVDGIRISMSDEDGWRLLAPSQLELVGAACDDFMQGDHDLRASFPCDVVVVR